MVNYEHISNIKLKGSCTEEQWALMRRNPLVRALYRRIPQKNEIKTTQAKNVVKAEIPTPPEIAEKKVKKHDNPQQ